MVGIKPETVITQSPDETEAVGYRLGELLPEGSVVCFFGDLGAGKTTFIKGLVRGVAQIDSEEVNSPTFVYLNIYEGTRTVYHFDLYRLNNSREFVAMGFDEYVGGSGVCCMEWSEKIEDVIPANCVRVEMKHIDQMKREVRIIP